MPQTLRAPFTLFVLATAAAAAGVVGFTASAGVRDDMLVASAVAILAAGGVVAALARRSGFAALVASAPPLARGLFVAGTLAAGAQAVWLTAFIIDPSRSTWGPNPLAPLPSTHSCASSYWVAGGVVSQTPEIYDENHYSLPRTSTGVRNARMLGRFRIDTYEYPPSFLVLTRPLQRLTPDFWGFRRLWFALNYAVVLLAAVIVARRLDGRLGTHALWLTPFVVAAPPIVSTFQTGNVQMGVIALSALAMAAFDRRAHALGGALLAYATLGKLYPGVFVLYLLLRRDWRALGWTAGFAALLLGMSLADVGWAPYAAFLHEMPSLMNGEAFAAFTSPNAIGNNGSVPGLVFKLGLFGLPHGGFTSMRILGWLYTAVVVGGTAWLALRARPVGREPVAWLVILILATMRSPFLPTYAAFPSLWLATLLVALAWRQGSLAIVPMAAWMLLALGFGAGGIDARLNAIWTTAQTAIAFGLVWHRARSLRTPPTQDDAAPAAQAVPA
jgi:alpha-1,2-mannosyltransferase